VPASIVLYGKPDCHLCEQAEAIVGRVTAELGVSWDRVDIRSTPALFERFKYRIPVIEIGGGATLDWPTTAERVRRAILAADPR
jgi:hypothetical protein